MEEQIGVFFSKLSFISINHFKNESIYEMTEEMKAMLHIHLTFGTYQCF